MGNGNLAGYIKKCHEQKILLWWMMGFAIIAGGFSSIWMYFELSRVDASELIRPFILFQMLLILWMGFLLVRQMRFLKENKVLNLRDEFGDEDFFKKSRKLISLGQETVSINHDMNNILTIALAFSSSFKRQLKDYPDLETKFVRLDKTLSRLASLTAALRRSILGKDGVVEKFRIFDVVSDCFIILNSKFIGSHMLLVNDIGPEFEIEMQKDLLYQIFLNLISNAIEASENTSEKWVRLRLIDSTDFYEIQVLDGGPGLSAEVREKLFKTQVTTKVSGTGIGLSYLKRRLIEIGGDLIFDEVQAWTCFTVLIPKVVTVQTGDFSEKIND